MGKLIISCEDEEAIAMALLDRDVLDHLPTDQKRWKMFCFMNTDMVFYL